MGGMRFFLESGLRRPKTPSFLPSHPQRHTFSSLSNLFQSQLPTAIPLSSRRILAIHGQDAASFLQGLTTRDILHNPGSSSVQSSVVSTKAQQDIGSPSSPSRKGLYAAFLSAQGRVLNDVHIYPTSHVKGYRERLPSKLSADDPGYLIDVDASQADKLKSYLLRFKLRAKIQVWIPEQGEWGIWSGFGWPQEDGISTQNENGEDISASRITSYISRLGFKRMVLPGTQVPIELERGNATQLDESEYKLHRIAAGFAEGQAEIISGSALPQESNLDALGAIDFRKGCYVGQELTIRTHHTGVVRKRILPVKLSRNEGGLAGQEDLAESLTTGADIRRVAQDGRQGRPVGKWLGGVGDVGLAVCRVDELATFDDGSGSLGTPPDRRFKVDDNSGNAVWITARMPGWLRLYLESSLTRGSPSRADGS